MTDAPGSSWFHALPKAEVHVHLEGCIPPDLLDEAARRAGTEVPRADVATGGLAGLLAYLDASCRLLTEAHDIEVLGYRFAERLAENGTLYADLIVNPTHWPGWSKRFDEFVDAFHTGARAAEADGLPRLALCPSIKRNQSREQAMALVELLVSMAHPRVVGLSIDGDESAAAATSDIFAPAFERAAESGLRRCAHSGESSGPEGVRDALDLLHAERIDHGVRAVEDPSLVEELAERRVPLDVCPTSNVVLGLYPDTARHPIEALRRAGVRVSVNTDDPEILGIGLAGEYQRAAAEHGWSPAVVGEMARTSIDACFAPEATKAEMADRLDGFLRSGEEAQ